MKPGNAVQRWLVRVVVFLACVRFVESESSAAVDVERSYGGCGWSAQNTLFAQVIRKCYNVIFQPSLSENGPETKPNSKKNPSRFEFVILKLNQFIL